MADKVELVFEFKSFFFWSNNSLEISSTISADPNDYLADICDVLNEALESKPNSESGISWHDEASRVERQLHRGNLLVPPTCDTRCAETNYLIEKRIPKGCSNVLCWLRGTR